MDPDATSRAEPENTALKPRGEADPTTAKLVYFLYLGSLILPVTALIGVIVAYVNRADPPAWLATHFQFQIRTFWIAVLYTIVGGITVWILVGWLVLLYVLIWLIVRCVVGLKYAARSEAVPQPGSWLFGT